MILVALLTYELYSTVFYIFQTPFFSSFFTLIPSIPKLYLNTFFSLSLSVLFLFIHLPIIIKIQDKSMSSNPPPNDQVLEEDKIIDDGFSSEQQLQHEEIIIDLAKEEQPDNNHREEVKFKIPPPQEIKDKTYSLHPDMETGWNTKKDLPQPIPIIFQSGRYDILIKKLLRQPKNKIKLIYLGPRYENTYYSWYDKSFPFPYGHIKAPNDMIFTNRPFCGQHWEAEDELQFDSFFQGGNLDSVIRVGEREYDCFMRVDSNTAGHLQWFNFRVKGWKRLLKYKINICNFQKDKCLFARGMKPYLWSKQASKRQGQNWCQGGENICFERKPLAAAKAFEFDMRQMFRLSFQHYTQYDNDEVQVCYCIPYTYTKLGQFLHGLNVRPETKTFLKVSKLCTSLGGLQVPLMVIHQGLDQSKEDEDGIGKRCVVISGRAHPGQSNGSHMIEGFISWLCSDSKQAVFLRKYVVFKIVPMLNPDGVALGNYRTGLSGRDFNREYRNPDKGVFPEVFHFKKLVQQNKELFGDRLLMFLDFHGHSTKKNTFMYGPEFPIIDRYYYEARIFPKLLGNITPMFRYYSCVFKINQCKISTARAVLLRRLGVPLSYTIETSNGSFFDYEGLKDVPFNQEKWLEMGAKVGVALGEYADLLITTDRIRWEKKQAKKKDKEKERKEEKMRRSPGRVPNKNKGNKAEQGTIFSAMENQKIRHLFQQIRHAEDSKTREQALVSDDQMSEGSSDGEGAEDDLSPQQTNFLIQMIKGGKYTRSKNHIKTKSRSSTRKTTEDIMEPLMPNIFSKHEDIDSQEVFRGRKAINIRKPVSKERIVSVQQKKFVSTAKIINFSFCSQNNNRPKDQKLKYIMPSRLNFVQMVHGKWSQQRTVRRQSISKNKVVMDLSDPHFRKTFGDRLREKQQPVLPSNTYLPNKRGRFQQYKYRRMLLQNEGEMFP